MVRKAIRIFKKKVRHAKMCLVFMHNKKSFLAQPSYYDENNKKNNLRIIFEALCYIWKYGEVNKFYYAYGLDQKGRKSGEYLAVSEFMNERNKKNYTRPFDYLCILRDKNIFSIVAKAFGIPAVSNMGVLCNGVVFSNKHLLDEPEIFAETDSIFIKAIAGECGQKVLNVKKCKKSGGVFGKFQIF